MAIDSAQFEAQRPRLFAIAYRMLGSAAEAEDVVQDAYLRAAADGAAVATPAAYLATVVSRLCLDRLKSARAAREQYIGPWLPEPILTAPPEADPGTRVEHDETLTMALLLTLEALSPLERAVFLLREAFDYPFDEIGTMLERNSAACRQAHHRARTHIAAGRPRFRAASEQQRRLVERFLGAAREGNLAALTGMLSADATFYGDGGGRASSARHPVCGADLVGRMFAGMSAKVLASAQPLRFVLTWINGEVGLLVWAGEILETVNVFECDDTQIVAIRSVRNPDKLAYLARSARAGPPPFSVSAE